MADPALRIRKAAQDDIAALAGIIRGAFQDMALRFGLTAPNCPKHPSHCEDSWMAADMQRGVRMTPLRVPGA